MNIITNVIIMFGNTMDQNIIQTLKEVQKYRFCCYEKFYLKPPVWQIPRASC